MEIYKTMVPLKDGLYKMDTIEYEGQFWLVPEWIDTDRKGWSRPQRIVSLTTIPHLPMDQKSGCKFLVNNPIPKEVLSGSISAQLATQYVIVERPNIEFETHAHGQIH